MSKYKPCKLGGWKKKWTKRVNDKRSAVAAVAKRRRDLPTSRNWKQETNEALPLNEKTDEVSKGPRVRFIEDVIISLEGWDLLNEAINELKLRARTNNDSLQVKTFWKVADLPPSPTDWEGRALMETFIKQGFDERALFDLTYQVCLNRKRPARKDDFSLSLTLFAAYLTLH